MDHSHQLSYSGYRGEPGAAGRQNTRAQENEDPSSPTTSESEEILDKDLPRSQRKLYQIIRSKYLVKANLPPPRGAKLQSILED